MAAIALPETLDLKAAGPLKAAFMERRGEAIEVDATEVRRLGGLCLQILLAAKQGWATDGQAFAVTKPSDAFLETLRLFGADGALLSTDTQGAPS
jgi:chemotaxis protein CheX